MGNFEVENISRRREDLGFDEEYSAMAEISEVNSYAVGTMEHSGNFQAIQKKLFEHEKLKKRKEENSCWRHDFSNEEYGEIDRDYTEKKNEEVSEDVSLEGNFDHKTPSTTQNAMTHSVDPKNANHGKNYPKTIVEPRKKIGKREEDEEDGDDDDDDEISLSYTEVEDMPIDEYKEITFKPPIVHENVKTHRKVRSGFIVNGHEDQRSEDSESKSTSLFMPRRVRSLVEPEIPKRQTCCPCCETRFIDLHYSHVKKLEKCGHKYCKNCVEVMESNGNFVECPVCWKREDWNVDVVREKMKLRKEEVDADEFL